MKEIVSTAGPFEVTYAGKAHPQDPEKKEIIQRILQAQNSLRDRIKIANIEN